MTSDGISLFCLPSFVRSLGSLSEPQLAFVSEFLRLLSFSLCECGSAGIQSASRVERITSAGIHASLLGAWRETRGELITQ